ncbi:uncharacterized protein LOC113769209 [Coffea eugenioides]|uniref:uncharacterized protein LOC113769209 n=1 Tax=Coffea eugenioides TaxID=49369 RepID=UPI000F60E0DA|nr:uncharacterized protein LOC113769209 [Coffea eugenioides]
MAVLQPSEGAIGAAPPLSKSFAAVVTASSSAEVFDLGTISTRRGEPAFRIANSDIQQLARLFQQALVGRFSYSRPPMEAVRRFFLLLGLKGDYAVALLDTNHVLIRPTVEEDYIWLFVRRTWYIRSSPMTISKWFLDFKANKEISIAPVWVSFPSLPLPFFGRNPLNKLASVLGRPLKIDAATGDLRRLSVARVLVEIDVARAPAKRVWIGDEEYGFWQNMEYESWPAFCSFCERFGHDQQECYRKFPALRPAKNPQAHLPQPKDPLPQGDQGTTMARGEDVGEWRDV